jgi:tetratricopeptide (TPR) repeat protein
MASVGDVTGQSTLPRRELLLHDSLTFLILIAISLALYGVTHLLFHSFESHRADLAVRWAERGQQALALGHPDEAVTALRTALTYAPDDRPDQLLLAQALASAGHTEEASNYFLNLWDARPGDGFINLQLARLSRTRRENKQAIDYYRASIYGSWPGDAILRRRQVRLELSDFLITQHQLHEARDELNIVAGNAPPDPTLILLIASKLEAAEDPASALDLYAKVLAIDPHNQQALAQSGRIAYTLGDYLKAQHLLQRAVEDRSHSPALDDLFANSRRIQLLTLTRDQPASDRTTHILLAARIAQDRLKSCVAQIPSSAITPIPLASLASRWTAATSNNRSRRTLPDSAEAQDTWTLLINQTELITAQTCGQPTGDDALLLRLAHSTETPGITP